MIVLPAIDIKDGQCVRLVQGDFAQKTVVNDDPLTQAATFQQGGASYLHIVDLDGALEGRAVNRDLIATIKQSTHLPIEVGGGIRTLKQIEDYLNVGIDRVIIGSAALTNPELVKEAVAIYGDKIAVGIDAKNGQVAISGWLDVSTTDFITFAKEMDKLGVQTLIYTDISKDGTLTGPNINHYKKLLSAVECNIIASGGVSNKKDLLELKELGVTGAIVGKAYYNGNISLEEMREVTEC